MRKHILALMITIISIAAAQAQRMMPRQKGLEVNAGLLSKDTDNNYYLNVTLTINGKNGNYWLGGAEYSHQFADYRNWEIPLETYTGELGYSLRLLGNVRKSITLNAGLTTVAGYETINRSKAMLSDGATILDKDNFIYGAGGRLSLETYLSDRFVLLLQGRTKVIWGTDLKQFRPSAGLGLRFNF